MGSVKVQSFETFPIGERVSYFHLRVGPSFLTLVQSSPAGELELHELSSFLPQQASHTLRSRRCFQTYLARILCRLQSYSSGSERDPLSNHGPESVVLLPPIGL